MCDFEDYKTLSIYSRKQAIDDGVLVPVFDAYITKQLIKFTNGKQILASSHLANDVKAYGLRDIWNRFAVWKQDIEAGLPEEEKLYRTSVNEKTVLVIEDDEAITLIYGSDY